MTLAKKKNGVYLVSEGTNQPYKCKIRAPSFAHWAAMAGKKAQKYYEGKAKQVDDDAAEIYKDHGVEVISLTPAEYDTWVEVAKQSS